MNRNILAIVIAAVFALSVPDVSAGGKSPGSKNWWGNNKPKTSQTSQCPDGTQSCSISDQNIGDTDNSSSATNSPSWASQAGVSSNSNQSGNSMSGKYDNRSQNSSHTKGEVHSTINANPNSHSSATGGASSSLGNKSQNTNTSSVGNVTGGSGGAGGHGGSIIGGAASGGTVGATTGGNIDSSSSGNVTNKGTATTNAGKISNSLGQGQSNDHSGNSTNTLGQGQEQSNSSVNTLGQGQSNDNSGNSSNKNTTTSGAFSGGNSLANGSESTSSVGDTNASIGDTSLSNDSASFSGVGDTSSNSGGNTMGMVGGANTASNDSSGNSDVRVDASDRSVTNYESQALVIPTIMTAAPALVANPALVVDRGACGPRMTKVQERVNGTYVGVFKRSSIDLGVDDELVPAEEPYRYWTSPSGVQHVFGHQIVTYASVNGVAASRSLGLGGGRTGGDWGQAGASSGSSVQRTVIRVQLHECEVQTIARPVAAPPIPVLRGVQKDG